MRILILGAGKMGSFFTDTLCLEHEVGLFDPDKNKLRYVFNTIRMNNLSEVEEFNPELVINCVTIKNTIDAFEMILPHISERCIIADIASVKTGLPEYYAKVKRPFVSTHPMFGPTFATLSDLRSHNAIIIAESDYMGKMLFKELYRNLKLNIFEYTFEEHDQTIAYSLSIPFASTLAFASVMKHQEAPGTTFKKHMAIAEGLLGEDDYLLREILFNPYTSEQLERIQEQLSILQDIIRNKDNDAMQQFLEKVRSNIR